MVVFDPDKVYAGTPCKHGHTIRYKKSRTCVECAARLNKSYPDRSPKYRANHPERIFLSSAKARAKKQGIRFHLTVDDLPPLPEFCPVLGIPIYKSSSRATDNSPSLDRIIPHLGYIPNNVHWISWRANQLKSDATFDELRMLADYFTNFELRFHGTQTQTGGPGLDAS